MNFPDYNFLPAPLWLLTILHWLTLTLHFAAMNFVFGGGLILLLARLDNKWQNPAVQRYVKLFPALMAATVTLGVAPLLFLQLTYHQQVYSATIVSAWPWLLVPLIAMLAYYCWYAVAYSKKGNYTPYIVLAILGMTYVSIVYSATFALAEQPAAIAEGYRATQSGWFLNPDIGSYLVRWLHTVLGVITVGGYFVGLVGRDNQAVYSVGKKFFLYGMVGASLAGFVYLFTLGDMLVPYMRSPGIWVLTAAIIVAVASLHFYFKKRFLLAGVATFLALFGMVVNRHILRLVQLAGKWDPANIPLRPQWDVLLLFLICFVLALGLVTYMLKLLFANQKAVTP